jgi:hypothetical protein
LLAVTGDLAGPDLVPSKRVDGGLPDPKKRVRLGDAVFEPAFHRREHLASIKDTQPRHNSSGGCDSTQFAASG